MNECLNSFLLIKKWSTHHDLEITGAITKTTLILTVIEILTKPTCIYIESVLYISAVYTVEHFVGQN